MFYDNFLKVCATLGVTPSRVLNSVGISRGSLSNWKGGGDPVNETKKKIADELKITIEELNAGELKKPAIENDDGKKNIDSALYDIMRSLTPEEAAQARAFAQGLISARNK